MPDIDAFLDAVFQGADCSGPASVVAIHAAETQLGLLFPPSYRRFLEKYGATAALGLEINGLPEESTDPDQPPLWSNVVRSTKQCRPNSLPDDSIEISDDGSEFRYFLHCSRSDPRYEGPVIEWGPAHDGGKQFAANFLEFIESMRRRHWKLA